MGNLTGEVGNATLRMMSIPVLSLLRVRSRSHSMMMMTSCPLKVSYVRRIVTLILILEMTRAITACYIADELNDFIE